MSYDLIIEGLHGARKIRAGRLPRRGEWIGLKLEDAWCWLPVLDVAYILSPGESLEGADEGCGSVHESAQGLVISSLALGVRAEAQSEEETVKFILPPTRWPLGGQLKAIGEEYTGGDHE